MLTFAEIIIQNMKKTFILAFLVGLFSFVHAQPNISELKFPNTVSLFGKYEIAFQMDDYANPYDPDVIDVFAEFVSPEGKTIKVNGFYYEGYQFTQQQDYERATPTRDQGWRVRFTPEQTGTWTFALHAIDKNGENVIASTDSVALDFQCLSVDSAQGFIALGNTRFLKRDVVENGTRTSQPFYPCGPNVAWYEYSGSPDNPRGIYGYKHFAEALEGHANYMRIWLNRYQYLNLYGPEYTQKTGGKPTVYFDSTLNQKDAAELDNIIECTAQHGISIMPCFFSFGDFLEGGTYNGDPSQWKYNPFHYQLGLEKPTDFFADEEARRITKNLIRYIVARWGYATNIVCWEYWNEVDNIKCDNSVRPQFGRDIVSWHEEMAEYTRSIDPFNHPLTTSTVNFKENDHVANSVFKALDIVQCHHYGNIQKAKSREERAHQLFEKNFVAHKMYPDKPFFIGEFGFGQSKAKKKYDEKDPHGFDTHNVLWATLFSTSMGSASFWYWNYLDKNDLLDIYDPMFQFSKNLPRLSDSFAAHHTASIKKNSTRFDNGIQTYYMSNMKEDTLYGWCQDTAFSYQALRRLSDKVGTNGHFEDDGVFDPAGYVYTLDSTKKPQPSSHRNEITLPITEQEAGTQYVVRWFNGETGLEIASERTTATVKKRWLSQKKFITFEFPATIRDLKGKRVNNTFGDAAFIIVADNGENERSSTQGTAPEKKVQTIKNSNKH